ncbi:hypothetical protein GI582_22490 [Sulfitobacter sp. BDSS02]|nr:hypothetical protein [Sulfitobacter sp. BDSS02]
MRSTRLSMPMPAPRKKRCAARKHKKATGWLNGQAEMMDEQMIPGIGRIRARFLDMLPDRLNELEEFFAEMDEDSLDMEALDQSQGILHKIAGTAGTLGLQELGDMARTCENNIVGLMKKGTPDLEQVFIDLGRFFAIAEEALEDWPVAQAKYA